MTTIARRSQLFIAAACALWLTACSTGDRGARPRVLASDAARVSDLGSLAQVSMSTDLPGEMMSVRWVSCIASAAEKTARPRLVIGAPVCASHVAPRVD